VVVEIVGNGGSRDPMEEYQNKRKGYVVLFMVDYIDEYAICQLKKYHG